MQVKRTMSTELGESMASNDVSLIAREGWVIVALAGEFDLGDVDALSEYFRVAMVESPPRVVVDLSQATFLDSSILGALVGASKAACARSGSFRLAGAEDISVRHLLAITQVDAALGLYDDVDQAIKAH
jgi:anti-sigma B factor antagonist